MRKSYPSYSLVTLCGLLLAGSCSIIAEVDRTKIPQDGGPPSEGGQSTGGSSGSGTGGSTGGTTGGSAGNTTGGTSGSGTGGTAAEGGMGGEPGGMGGEPGMAGESGMGGAGAGAGGMPAGPVCGDGTIDSNEECDDGESPPMSGEGCSATCTEEAGWTCSGTPSICVAALCGDRIVAGAEVCDDGNSLACGTCSANCGVAQPSTAARGSISPGSAADLTDGDAFTLNDGTHVVVFEFDETPGDGVTQGRTPIVFDPADTAAALQTAIISAINGETTTLTITASAGTAAPNVNLVNDAEGSSGNQTSGKNIASATSTFAITNMTGGKAHDCVTNDGCKTDADCLNGTCSTSTHKCN